MEINLPDSLANNPKKRRITMKTTVKNAVVVVLVTRANIIAQLESLGGAVERMEKASAAICAFAVEQGVDMTCQTARQDFLKLFVGMAFEDGKWVENYSKKGLPASIDCVRLDGWITDTKTKEKVKKCHVPASSRKVAKGIYAAWQWYCDTQPKDASKSEDSLEKIIAGIAGLNTRLDAFNADKTVASVQADLLTLVGKLGKVK